MLLLPAQLESYRSLKDKTLKVTFETNELNPQELLSIIENTGEFGYLAFKVEPFKREEKEVIESLETNLEDKQKTPSQRLRAILYLNYQKKNEGFDTFTRYYEHTMEKLCTHFKTKLD
jgi:hypothetical protein